MAGLGLVMTRALAQNGAKRVYILGRRREVLENAISELSVKFVSLRCFKYPILTNSEPGKYNSHSV